MMIFLQLAYMWHSAVNLDSRVHGPASPGWTRESESSLQRARGLARALHNKGQISSDWSKAHLYVILTHKLLMYCLFTWCHVCIRDFTPILALRTHNSSRL